MVQARAFVMGVIVFLVRRIFTTYNRYAAFLVVLLIREWITWSGLQASSI